MVKKNDAPTEIETITLTMSRPVAEAVANAVAKAARESGVARL